MPKYLLWKRIKESKVLIPTSLNFSWRLMCEDENYCIQHFSFCVDKTECSSGVFGSLSGHIREWLDFFHLISEVFWGLWLMLSGQSSLCFWFGRLKPSSQTHNELKNVYIYIYSHFYLHIFFSPIGKKKMEMTWIELISAFSANGDECAVLI